MISKEQIRNVALPSIMLKAEEIARSGMVMSTSVLKDGFAGEILSNGIRFRCAATFSGDEFAWFDCTCGSFYGGACEHCAALLLSVAGGAVSLTGGVTVTEISGAPTARLYLTEGGGMLFVEIRFAYLGGLVEFRRIDARQTRIMADAGTDGFCRIVRSRAREAAATDALEGFGLDRYKTGVYTPLGPAREWIRKYLPALVSAQYDIYGQENLRECAVRNTKPGISVSVKSGDKDIACEITAGFDGVPASLGALMDAVRNNSRYVILADGSTGVLPADVLMALTALFAVAEMDAQGRAVRLLPSQMGVMHEILELADETHSDTMFRERVASLMPAAGNPHGEIPSGFSGTLRPYQHAGFNWMCLLDTMGLGGCLADDMGLGKTVQTIAFLLYCSQKNSIGPSLVVAPSSILFNWERETRKFVCGMPVMTYHGPRRVNYSDADFKLAKVVLTSYGTLLKDIDRLENLPFNAVILDEAQIIKNPASAISRAVCRIKAINRFALTGTPLENNLSELWSVFAFLNPGMLGRYRSFLRVFAIPIQKNSNMYALSTLKQITGPFIMRRTKKQVAPELPLKTESVIFLDMLPAQKLQYCVTRDIYRARISSSIERNGMEKSRFQILEGLLRLRQVCCHPALFCNGFSGRSAKFEEIAKMIPEIAGTGHRVLLFSQFVKALLMLREQLSSMGIATDLLTGNTSNRAEAVDRFQNGDAPVFLISLKAGGTGLNLTAADYVIHLDPWWNPAVEDQASDRAYRIGQQKPVFVYKYIVKESIEEQMLELQQKKRALAGQIIIEEGSFIKQLDYETIRRLFS